jgi:hypothetical protein
MGLEKRAEEQSEIVIASDKKINYNSRYFQKQMRKIHEENERLKELSKPDYERMRIVFDI